MFGVLLTSLLVRPVAAEPTPLEQDPPAHVKVQLEGADATVGLVKMSDGTHRFRLETNDGPLLLTPEQFAGRVHREQARRGWLWIMLNITSPIGLLWVAVGLGGQVLFTGRMIVQWLVSERQNRSVVPVGFWWLSLTGATMLITYFIWRKDAVGVLGQATGWLIYVRNLWMIYDPLGHRRPPAVAEDPAPEPELDTPGS